MAGIVSMIESLVRRRPPPPGGLPTGRPTPPGFEIFPISQLIESAKTGPKPLGAEEEARNRKINGALKSAGILWGGPRR